MNPKYRETFNNLSVFYLDLFVDQLSIYFPISVKVMKTVVDTTQVIKQSDNMSYPFGLTRR